MNQKNIWTGIAVTVLAVSAFHADGGREMASTKYGVIPSHPAIVAPFTYGAWVKLYTKATAQTLIAICGSADNYHQIQFNHSSGAFLTFTRQASTANTALAYATAFGTVSTNVWYFVAAVHSATNNRIIYVNGTPYATNTVSRDPAVTKIGFGARVEGASIPSATAEYLNGVSAHAAVWNVALTDAEVSQMAGGGNPSFGVSPIKIRPDKLVVYAPLHGVATAFERNEVGAVIALSNAPASVSTFKVIR